MLPKKIASENFLCESAKSKRIIRSAHNDREPTRMRIQYLYIVFFFIYQIRNNFLINKGIILYTNLGYKYILNNLRNIDSI